MVDGIFAIFDKIGACEAWAECIYTGWIQAIPRMGRFSDCISTCLSLCYFCGV